MKKRKPSGLFWLVLFHVALLLFTLLFLLLLDTPFIGLLVSDECEIWNNHFYCPGCGGSRAVRALAGGHILESLRYNPNVLLWLIMLFYIDLRTVIDYIKAKKGGKVPPALPHLKWWMLWVVLAVLLGYCLIQNLLLVFFGIDLIGDHAAFWVR